jgi:hypothetical protein
MSDLERELRELRVAWPATPDLAARVGERLAAAPARPRGSWRSSRIAWQLAAAVAAALIAVVMTVPSARSAVLDWLGFSSVRIERAEPRPTRAGSDLRLGRPVTLAQARREAGFRLVVPAALGPPDAVYLAPDPATRTRVDFVYRPRPGLPRSGTTGVGLLMTQFRAPSEVMIEKMAGQGTDVARLLVGGDPAFFLSGALHGFAYTSPSGGAFEQQRLAGNTLLVERGDGVLLRIEGELSRSAAVRIAASVG